MSTLSATTDTQVVNKYYGYGYRIFKINHTFQEW